MQKASQKAIARWWWMLDLLCDGKRHGTCGPPKLSQPWFECLPFCCRLLRRLRVWRRKKTRHTQKDILSKHMVDNFEPSTQSLAPPSDENVDKIIIVIIAAAIKTEWTKQQKKTYRQIVVSNQWLIIVSEAFRVSSRTTDDSSPTHTQFTVGSYAHRQQHNGRNTPKIAKEKGSDNNNNTNDNRTTTKK